MIRARLFALSVAGLAALLSTVLTTQAIATTYSITDLGTLGGTTSGAWTINGLGQIAGAASTAEGTIHACVWRVGESAFDLGSLGVSGSGADSLYTNASNIQAVGASYLPCPYGNIQHAISWTIVENSVQATDLGSLGDSPSGPTNSGAQDVNEVNDSVEVVGHSWLINNTAHHAFLWTSLGGMQDLGTLGTPSNNASINSYAARVNNTGQIVGNSQLTVGGPTHACLWNAAPIDLGTLGGSQSAALDISNERYANVVDIVGYALDADGDQHAVQWEYNLSTHAVTTQDLGGGNYTAMGANDYDEVVGVGPFAPMGYAVVWNNGVMQQLNSLIPPGSGWLLLQAVSVNNAGQIVGVGTHNGSLRAFLLTPN